MPDSAYKQASGEMERRKLQKLHILTMLKITHSFHTIFHKQDDRAFRGKWQRTNPCLAICSNVDNKEDAGDKVDAPPSQPDAQEPPSGPPPDDSAEPEGPGESPDPQPPRSGASASVPSLEQQAVNYAPSRCSGREREGRHRCARHQSLLPMQKGAQKSATSKKTMLAVKTLPTSAKEREAHYSKELQISLTTKKIKTCGSQERCYLSGHQIIAVGVTITSNGNNQRQPQQLCLLP
eukprot:scaffold47437_cov18-Tisochrysis_lutea.AAC.4